MKITSYGVVWLGLAFAGMAPGASPANLAPTSTVPHLPSPAPGNLPKPLDRVAGGLGDLEATGFFAINKLEFGRTRDFGEEALLWTLRVTRPLACRHASLLLQRVGDVRFYRTLKQGHVELLSAELYFPSWIDSEAINGRILQEGQEFAIWILLGPKETQHLTLRFADTVLFNRLDRLDTDKN
jgi:hypothetical protein